MAVREAGPPAAPVTDNSVRLHDEIKPMEDLLWHPPTGFSDRGAVLYLLADHYVRLGEQAKGLALLQECVALAEGFSPANDPAFASLKNDRTFRGLSEQVQRSYPSVHQAHVAFTVVQGDLFPEGLEVDAAKRLFYMGSMHLKKIVKISDAGEVVDFVKPDQYDLMPILGVHIDLADHTVWCATYPGGKKRSEMVHFDERGQFLRMLWTLKRRCRFRFDRGIA